MSWTKTYKKYKDTELMKEFIPYFISFRVPKFNFEYGSGIGSFDIKDIYGYLICFAETKGTFITISLSESGNYQCQKEVITKAKTTTEKDFKTTIIFSVISKEKGYEQAMNWCAEKFFEVAK